MRTQKSISILSGVENTIFFPPLALLSSLAAVYFPLISLLIIILIVLYYFTLSHVFPFIVFLIVLSYLIAIKSNTIYFTLFLNTVLCFSPLLYYITWNKKYDLFSPYIIIPFLYWLFLCLGPSVLYALDLSGIPKYDYEMLRTLGLIYSGGILSYYLGIAFASKIYRGDLNTEFNVDISSVKFKTIFSYYILIHFILLAIFIFKVKSFPIFMPDPYQARIDVIQIVSGYVYNPLKFIGLFAVLYIYHYLVTKDRSERVDYYPFRLALYAFVLLIFLNWRSDFIMMALLIIVGYHYLKRPLSLKIAAFASIIIFAIAVIYDVLRQGKADGGLSSVTLSLYTTLFVDSSNLGIIMNNIPSYADFMHGNTFLSGIKMLLPGDDQALGETLRDSFNMMEGGGGITTTIFGEWYINFGMAGIFIGIFLLGVIAGQFYNWMKKQRDFFSVFIYAIIIYQVFVFIRIGLLTSIMPWLIIPMLIVYRKLCLSKVAGKEIANRER